MSRIRMRFGPIQYPQTIPLGNIIAQTKKDGIWVQTSNTYKTYSVPSARKYGFLQRTVDELHAGPPYRTGGPFDSVLMTDYGFKLIPVSDHWRYVTASLRYIYTGGFLPTWVAPSGQRCIDGVHLDKVGMTLGDISGLGAEAYAKFSPLKPKVDLGQTIAELREIPRTLRSTAQNFYITWKRLGGKSQRRFSSVAANEWLNTQFGWVPFLSSIIDTYKATKTLSNTLARLRKYNGQWEKRGGTVKDEMSRDIVYNGTGYIYPTLTSIYPPNRLRVYRVTKQKAWFVARYKYYLPSLDSMQYPPGVIAQIYGLRVTPTLLWNLTPWSWMIDWFANVGDILSAADDSQYGQLVTKYAYIMGKSETEYDIQARFSDLGHYQCSYSLSRKQRVGASPYGFDVHSTDLSPWKVSILAALGISRFF